MEQRSRAGRPNRRKSTLPSSSLQSDTSIGADSNSSIMTRSPPAAVSAASSRTPQTAPPNRRAAKIVTLNNPFSSVRSSPSTAASALGKPVRKKSRTGGFDGAADEEDEAYRKGPHTLRKRTKIDYSAADFEDELPEIAIPAPRTATRKRRADSEVADEEYNSPASQKRRATSRDFSVASLPAASRRRTPARKSVVEQHQQSFYSQPSDEDIVKDTIEVVGDSSDLISTDDPSEHEENVHDVSGGISLPDIHDPMSSPTRRKGQEARQHVSAVKHQQVTRQDERKPNSDQSQDLPAVAVAVAENDDPGPIIAHPQPVRVNQVTIINGTNTNHDNNNAQPAPAHSNEPLEDISFQPKREASSPVRPAESAPSQKATEPEAAPSAPGHETSAPAVVVAEIDEEPTVAVVNTEQVPSTVAPPGEGKGESVVHEALDGETFIGHVDATEVKSPPPKSPREELAQQQRQLRSPSPAPAPEPVHTKLPDSFGSLPTETVASVTSGQDETDIDAREEPNAEMPRIIIVRKASPAEVPTQPKVKKPRYPWSHLTPYVEGEFVTHSIYPVLVEGSAPTSNGDGNNENEIADETAENGDNNQAEGDGEDVEAEAEEVDRDADHEEEHPPDSQGQQLSQGSACYSEAPTPALTPRQGSPALPSTAITGSNTPAPPGPRQRFRKQYNFKKVRDPAEFIDFLKDTKKLSYQELWDLLAQANETLVAWQDEYKECTKIVDDQENAQRRAAQDAAFEKKTADLNAFAKVESYIEKDFEVQGYRATIKEKDAGTLEQRWQDRVMASAFGFEYDPHPNKVGNQDPDAQRDGGGEGRQLRSQPQVSAKAAEGDGVIVSGKRTRNPPKLFDGVLQDDTRSATPGGNKPLPKKRGRAAAAADKAAAAAAAVQEEAEAEAEVPNTSPAKGGRKRASRGKRNVVIESEPNTPAPEEEAIAAPPPEPEPQAPPKRKRGRQTKGQPAEEPAPEPEEPTPKRARKRQSNGHVAPPPETTDESRPTSSSSNATISDDGSTYGLRQNKRSRNYKGEAEADEEAVEAMPQPKRARIRVTKRQSAPEPPRKTTVSENILKSFGDLSAPATPNVPQLMMTFKLVGKDKWTTRIAPTPTPRQTSTDDSEYNISTPRPAPVSAPTSAKSSAPPSQAGGEEKDYSTMTKSEKMSASMKKRWLNGSMQGAVNKRKATLAAKKAAAAAADAAEAAARAQAQMAQQTPMHFQQHAGILPMPPGHPHGHGQ